MKTFILMGVRTWSTPGDTAPIHRDTGKWCESLLWSSQWPTQHVRAVTHQANIEELGVTLGRWLYHLTASACHVRVHHHHQFTKLGNIFWKNCLRSPTAAVFRTLSVFHLSWKHKPQTKLETLLYLHQSHHHDVNCVFSHYCYQQMVKW